jgi:hypothetical protein
MTRRPRNKRASATAKALFIEYLKNPTSRVIELPFKLWGKPLHELGDITVKTLLPSITASIRKAQIELHVESWKAGFNTRHWEIISSEGFAPFNPDPTFSEYTKKIKSRKQELDGDSFKEGYTYRQEAGNIEYTPTLQKRVIESGLRKWDDIVGEKVVLTILKNILRGWNPIIVISNLVEAVKRHGLWIALPIVFMELIYQSIPYWGFKYLGRPLNFAISQIPFTKILVPKYLKWFNETPPEEKLPEHLDWYEREFGVQKLARYKRMSLKRL